MSKKDIFYIKIAELTVEMRAKYPLSRKLCAGYILDELHGAPDIVAEASDSEIDAEMAAEGVDAREYCEFVCLYRAIAERLPEFDRIVFHGAA